MVKGKNGDKINLSHSNNGKNEKYSLIKLAI